MAASSSRGGAPAPLRSHVIARGAAATWPARSSAATSPGWGESAPSLRRKSPTTGTLGAPITRMRRPMTLRTPTAERGRLEDAETRGSTR